MRIIVGLGNPGQRYANTRHNAGFMALDRLARKLSFDPPAGFKSSLVSKGRFKGGQVVLAWPQTYMNLSGEAVRELAGFYKIKGEDILVLHDEMDLSPGLIKLNYGGGVAGHNGLSSILAQIRENFCRLKIGIGRPPKEIFVNGSADYVLGRFLDMEWELVDKALDAAADASITWLVEGLAKAQNQINRRPKPARADGEEAVKPKAPQGEEA